MEQRKNTNDVAVRDVKVLLSREECALSTGQYRQGNDAALKDAQKVPSREAFVLSMEQKSNNAALKDVQINPNEEECVRDTVHTAILTKNLLL